VKCSSAASESVTALTVLPAQRQAEVRGTQRYACAAPRCSRFAPSPSLRDLTRDRLTAPLPNLRWLFGKVEILSTLFYNPTMLLDRYWCGRQLITVTCIAEHA